ncbi:hypothetical protein ACLPJG_26595 [Pseudomonas aeruginosa]|jgi:hypothetical protein|uniref:Uncharacterized protein n=2 Tax=Pseudomonas TaxID=286 RepID=A0ABD4YMT2_9PSED|nr:MULTISPECIES: hypothetical protein [Pseudomonas]RFP99704.1 hypothetical protein D0O09_21070 [Pseudomonas putida]TXG98988.1 MAG: hypothetical protein E6R08_02920 [Nevskiaceae bacterium]AGZ38138.1 hypothetical protein PVLB_27007 [Pseudomonas sp. VLB120]MCF3157304.1 hypothetical protein [Pseudomonas juntendi]MDH0760469.1 hypothetical protein [Pseudomonas juntendi]
MAIEDVTELTQVNGQTQAQRLLDEGWCILAVCVIQDGSSQYAEYHLGRAKPLDTAVGPGVLIGKTQLKG